ncbi:MAG: SDR family NAD(P)-dependent oxidoreductase [Betaproteobacteria bacterium]|nr:SDR family NAD(P)-dependent oxidoreductase [Betaproteobacteria bacterium]
MNKNNCPLAIVGMSCLFPKAEDLQAYWANIKNGVDAITPIPAGTHWNAADYFNADPKAPDKTYAARGGFLSPVNFNPMEFGISPKDIEATDTTQLLSLVGAQQALVDAGYAAGSTAGRAFDRDRTSVILGVTGALELVIPLGARLGHPHWRRALRDAGVDSAVAEDVVQRISDSYVGWQENSFPGLLGNVAAGRIASRLDLGGTNCVVDAACASSLAAIHLASLELAAGRSDMVITGGVDTFNDIFMYMCFSKTPALSPTGDARPFDRDCDGTVLGEGLGMLVLKRLEDAERDGDRIYAVLKGTASSSDGRSSAIYAPRADGQKLALARAYEISGVTPGSIGMIEAHGTGTKVGDATELSSLSEVFQSSEQLGAWCALGSVKSQIGHTKAAAGVAGIIKAAMALHQKVLPPTIKVKQPLEGAAPGRSPFYVNTDKRPWLPTPSHPRRAGVSALGFGGTNFHCVLEEHGETKQQVDWDGDVEILAFSSDSLAGLKAQIAAHPADSSWLDFRRAAHDSRQSDLQAAHYRLLMVAGKETVRASLRDTALTMLEKNPEKASWTAPAGIAFGSGKSQGKIAALFPGQGSQYVGMLRDLACQFPGMLDALAEADGVFASAQANIEASRSGSPKLSDFIYPHPAFSDEARQQQERALKSTDIAQPALGAVSMGALRILNYFGVTAQAACGHSYGELSALCGAGRIQPEALHQLSNLRGRLMAAKNGGADRGAMLAVQADEETVLAFLREYNQAISGERNGGDPKVSHQLVMANRNSPRQFVLAGPTEDIETAAGELTSRSIRASILPVSAAFHSPLVADARAPFAAALEVVAFANGGIPVYANATGRDYPKAAKQARETLADQIVRPVNFMEQIQAMINDGVRTFIEVGPGHVLCDLAQAIIGGQDLRAHAVETIALDASKGKRSGVFDLALALSRIASLGHAVKLTQWESAPAPAEADSQKPALTIALTGANHRAPHSQRPPVAALVTQSTPVQAGNTTAPVLLALPRAPHEPVAYPEELPAALRAAQEGVLALQRLQEQTAQLHKQFLEGQESARRSIHALLGLQSGIAWQPAPAESATSPVSIPKTATPERQVSSQIAPAQTRSAPVVQSTSQAPLAASANERDTEKTLATAAPQRITCEQTVLQVVSDKTGYPVEMLSLEMGMDSDLGIDSIKRVEIMATLRGLLPGAPEIKPEHLGSLQTLEQVVAFLADGHSDNSAKDAAANPTPTPTTRPPTTRPEGMAAQDSTLLSNERVGMTLLAMVAEKTGYPVEMLNLDMGMDSDLGIDSIKRVEIMASLRTELPGSPEIKPEQLGSLQTLRQIVDFLVGESDRAGAPFAPATPPAEPRTVTQQPQIPVDLAPIALPARADFSRSVDQSAVLRQIVRPVELSGNARERFSLPRGSLVWLTDDGSLLSSRIEGRLRAQGLAVLRGDIYQKGFGDGGALPAALVIVAPAGGCKEGFLKQVFRLMQLAAPSLRRTGAGGGTQAAGHALFATVSRLDGAFGFGELGAKGDAFSGGLAGLVKTASREWPEVHCKALDLNPDAIQIEEAAEETVAELFRVGPLEVGLPGGAHISLEVVSAPLPAKATMPAPLDQGDVVIVTGGARGVTGEAALEMARVFRPTLVLLGRSELADSEPVWLQDLNSEAEIKKAFFARAEGERSPRAVEAKYLELVARREIRTQLARLEAAGARAIYRSADVRDPLAVAKAISDIRLRHGAIRGLVHGAGVLADRRIEDKTDEQFDSVYDTKVTGLQNLLGAMANDPLKIIALFSSYTGRYGRVGQVDYAAANEVLNKMAQVESRRRAGCRVVSINWGPWNGGMVTPGLRKVFEQEGVGLIEPAAGAEFLVRELRGDGKDVEVLAIAPSSQGARPGDTPPFGEAAPRRDIHVPRNLPAVAGTALAFEREVSVKALPCLESHVLNGRAVLPAALMVEWLAQAALHGNPGMAFHGLDNFKVLKGVVLDADQSITVSLHAGEVSIRTNLLAVSVRMSSRSGERLVLHAEADVLLTTEKLPAAPAPALNNVSDGGFNDAYTRGVLFHGADLHGIQSVEGCTEQGVAATVKAAPSPRKWIKNPLRGTWIADPLALDSAFQMMILWSSAYRAAPSLPSALARYRQFVSAFPKTGCRVVIGVALGISAMTVATIEFLDERGNLLAAAEGCECVVDASLSDAFRLNRLGLEK